MRAAVASRNPGKLAELRRLLHGQAWELVGLDDAGFSGELDEPADTYAENAAAKALAVCAATGMAALADDSGIEVPGLGGWPGAASARWLGATPLTSTGSTVCSPRWSGAARGTAGPATSAW